MPERLAYTQNRFFDNVYRISVRTQPKNDRKTGAQSIYKKIRIPPVSLSALRGIRNVRSTFTHDLVINDDKITTPS